MIANEQIRMCRFMVCPPYEFAHFIHSLTEKPANPGPRLPHLWARGPELLFAFSRARSLAANSHRSRFGSLVFHKRNTFGISISALFQMSLVTLPYARTVIE